MCESTQIDVGFLPGAARIHTADFHIVAIAKVPVYDTLQINVRDPVLFAKASAQLPHMCRRLSYIPDAHVITSFPVGRGSVICGIRYQNRYPQIC